MDTAHAVALGALGGVGAVRRAGRRRGVRRRAGRPLVTARFIALEGIDGSPQPEFTGCHQPCERVTGTDIPVAWFAHGLRVVDIANPHAPREVAHFLPPVPAGSTRVSSNDVCVDDRGLLYLIDRGRCLHILERV